MLLIALEGGAAGGAKGEQSASWPQALGERAGRRAGRQRALQNRGEEGLPCPLSQPAALRRGEEVV